MKSFSLKRLVFLTLGCALLLPTFASCQGNEGIESSETTPETTVITIGEVEYDAFKEHNLTSDREGVYIYTNESGNVTADAPEGAGLEYFDVAVIDNVVIAVYENNKSGIIPESGYLLRFMGVDASVSLGDKVDSDIDVEYLPEEYVRFGDVVIEIGYKNAVRTAEETGWLYNEHWYNGNTESNIYCTEIAVSDGKIVEINRSGDNIAGISIPKGGFVLTVGESTALERKTAKLKVGDEATLVSQTNLYSYKKYGYAGEDRKRPDDGIVIYNPDQGTTPVGNSLTEVVVNKDHVVTAIHTNCSGMYKIPEGGFIVSSTGLAATRMAREVEVGDTAIKTGARGLCFVQTPTSKFKRLKSEFDAICSDFDESLKNLDNIDFMKVDSIINSASAYLENDEIEGEELANAVKSLQKLEIEARNELVPYITVQDRTAWVTLGEYDASMKIALHYTNQAEVDHTVNYAKLCGLNTLIIDNVACGFSVYQSEVEGLVMLPQLKGFDLIDAFGKACDEQGIRLIVMVNAFSSGLDGVVYPENHYMSIYSDKYLITNKGNHVGPDKVITLDPADKDIQAFNLAIVRELAEKYDIYGIQADYMRYPLPYYYQLHNYEDFGYNEGTIKGFIAKYGKNPAEMKINDPLWEDWCAWRRDIISGYQKDFYQTIKAVDPNLHVSFTCFADYRDRQIYTYQDVEKWAANGYADAIYPMIYGDNTEYQLKYANEILPITEHTTLILGVGTYVRASHESMIEQLIMPYELCAEGISVFTLRYISTCGYDETYRNAFRVEATPATAKDAELIPACADMLKNRIENLCFAQKSISSVDEALDAFFKEKADEVEALGGEITDFSEFVSELNALKDEVLTADGMEDTVKDAFVQAIDYIVSLA